jgi:hypothetical protein
MLKQASLILLFLLSTAACAATVAAQAQSERMLSGMILTARAEAGG